MALQPYFATCGRGIEEVLANELKALGAGRVEVGRGGAHFHGDRATLYRANLWLRTAIRVLQPILEVTVTSPEELYQAMREVPWSNYMTLQHTFAVDCNVRDSQITHSKYAALRVKDAICDQFRDRTGQRPSVDTDQPLLALNLHIDKDKAVLSLDSTAGSLHKRGYRAKLHRAAINEALAAALILKSGWNGNAPLIDPLCGSGTFAIEATWIATGRPPGLTRRRYGFQGWLDFDRRLWTSIRDEARQQILHQLPVQIEGSDIRRDVLRLAEENAKAAGIGHLLKFYQRDVESFTLPEGPPGMIICNPPYGARIGEEKELRALYQSLGRMIQRAAPWQVFLLTGNSRLLKEIRQKPKSDEAIFNGKIPCRFVGY